MIVADRSRELVEVLRDSEARGPALRRQAMNMLSALPGYNWSGVYRLEDQMLLIDEYVGAPTEHDVIPVGIGVCGTAVAEGRNQLVEDVEKLDNYLACSLETRSEIVVLIKDSAGTIIGQIDIDSHSSAAFDESDEKLLSDIAAILAERWA